MIFRNMKRNGLILGGFAIAATSLIILTQLLTADRIAEQERRDLMRTLNELIPPALHDNDLYEDCTLILAEDAPGPLGEQPVYRSRMAGEPTAVALRTTAPDGYSGNIHMLIAYDMNARIKGVRVLRHRETPGLGDKIELQKSDWILGFAGERVRGPSDSRWEVRKQGGVFDQFTGATITPRAVVNSVQRTTLFVQENMDLLFSAPANCISGDES